MGQGASGPATFDLLFGISPPAGTIARPAIATGTATVQGTVTLANTALLRGLALSTGTATALSGTGPLSGIDVSQTSVTTTTGTAVNLNNAVGSYSFSSITTNGAANGILLDTMGGSTFAANAVKDGDHRRPYRSRRRTGSARVRPGSSAPTLIARCRVVTTPLTASSPVREPKGNGVGKR